MDEELFLQLLIEWAAFEESRRRFNKKVRAIARKAGISKQRLAYHLKKRTHEPDWTLNSI